MSRASADNENGSLFFFFNSNCRLCYFFFSTKKPYHDFHFLFLIRASSGPFCSLFIYLLYPLISFLGKSSFSFCRAGGAGGGGGGGRGSGYFLSFSINATLILYPLIAVSKVISRTTGNWGTAAPPLPHPLPSFHFFDSPFFL